MIKRIVAALSLALILGVGGSQRMAQADVTQRTASPCTTRAACMHTMMAILNRTRARHGLTPLALQSTQSFGAAHCVGSYGHSMAMARTGTIWHTNPDQPQASFPHNICTQYHLAGENVGEFTGGDVAAALKSLHAMMMREPHDGATCSSTVNHACNILNGTFRYVGIGIYVNGSTTWLTEDFTG